MSKKNEVRIQDDLYQAINAEWIKGAKIPSDMPVTGSFMEIDRSIEETLMADFDAFLKGKKSSDVPAMADAVRLYKKALDNGARENAGMKPLFPLLDKIKAIKSIDEYNANCKDLLFDRVAMPFTFDVIEDVTDTSKRAFMIFDPQTILPDKTLYDNTAAKTMMMLFFKKMMKKLLKFSPLDKAEQKKYLEDTIAFDELISKKVLSRAEMSDFVKLFNPMSLAEVAEKVLPYDLKGLLNKIYGDKTPQEVNVTNPTIINGFHEILNENTFEIFLHWTYVWTILKNAEALSKKIIDVANSYTNAIAGVKKNPDLKKQAYRLVTALYDQPIGIYYGRMYFGEEAKADVIKLVHTIIDTYKLRMQKNTFLSEATKERALLKLSTMKVKMGYPDHYDELFDTLKLTDEESYFDAVKKIWRRNAEDKFERLLKPTDFTEWGMPAHMINAMYDPFKNDITFPAGILQKPFYDLHQKYEENLGGIGIIIGHEISHAFDTNGSHFDENGCKRDWWQEEDFKKFEALAKNMVEQWDGVEYHGVKIRGDFVVGENIADNGGMAVTIDIMHTLDNPDFKAYFINDAKVWRQKAKESYTKLLLTIDEHSPAELRTNIPPRNFKEWYEAFDVKETDKMYLAEDKRINIW